jgi:hypothetical protein
MTIPDGGVPLPRFGPGGVGREGLVDALDSWVRSDAMRRLADASGWAWPGDDVPLDEALGALVAASAAWDFRKRLFESGERHALTSIPAEVGGDTLDEGLIAAAAADLGLAGAACDTGAFTHVAALGGMARACLNRAREAKARLDAAGGEATTVALLSAHRPLAGKEPGEAAELGWGDLSLESEAAVAAMRDVFGPAVEPEEVVASWWDGDAPPTPDGYLPSAADRDATWPDEWRRRLSWSQRRWHAGGGQGLRVEVVAAPSATPLARRTNTADQLAWWAERVGLGPEHHVLLVTTDHYVPAQHFEAVRALGLDVGCGVATCGVEWRPTGPYQGAAYLQEVRSALLAAERLLGAVREDEGAAPG